MYNVITSHCLIVNGLIFFFLSSIVVKIIQIRDLRLSLGRHSLVEREHHLIRNKGVKQKIEGLTEVSVKASFRV